MDPVSLTPIAFSLVLPYLQKIAEKAVEALPDAVGKVWDVVKEKMTAKPETASLPADLEKTPDSTVVQGAFQYQLEKLLANDDAFAKQLAELVEVAKNQQGVSTSYSANVNGGGAIAQGDGAKAVGQGGIMIGGSVSGSTVFTGDNNTINSDEKKKK